MQFRIHKNLSTNTNESKITELFSNPYVST